MNGSERTMIQGKEAVIAELGYWPEFCDAKISELVFNPYTDVGARLSVLLHYIDMDINRKINIEIVLSGVSDMDFNEFRVENVIDRLTIDRLGISDSLIFEIEAAAGLCGWCTCEAVNVEVISSKPYS